MSGYDILNVSYFFFYLDQAQAMQAQVPAQAKAQAQAQAQAQQEKERELAAAAAAKMNLDMHKHPPGAQGMPPKLPPGFPQHGLISKGTPVVKTEQIQSQQQQPPQGEKSGYFCLLPRDQDLSSWSKSSNV